ncbi:MAG: hypothetical protein Q9220_000807 [cf. Caloplaca sp. 1 TL-2023]
MDLAAGQDHHRKKRRKTPSPTSTYVFRPLLEDIALLPEGHSSTVYITCVELWDVNLYIGTSASEILHYVAIPPDQDDTSASPTYIFASRLQPTYNQSSTSSSPPGVQQILVLPNVMKACVLCNGTLTFYSLPELSPAFGNTVVSGCSWIGGENLNAPDEAEEDGQTVMICIKSRIRLVRIGDEPRKIKNIEYPGCVAVARRDQIACVADAQAYSLLDVKNQQKVSLFPVSSLDDNTAGGQVEDISSTRENSRPLSGIGEPKGHGRSTSLGTFVTGFGRRSPQSRSQDRSGRNTPEPGMRGLSPLRPPDRLRSGSVAGESSQRPSTSEKPLPPPPEHTPSQQASQSAAPPSTAGLVPHICSPTPTEFLLTTGISPEEPGVGLFVNLEGDVVRGTLQFDRYPISLVVDSDDQDIASSAVTSKQTSEGYILASTLQRRDDGERQVVEIQKWDFDSDSSAEHLDIPHAFREDIHEENQGTLGDAKLRTVLSHTTTPFSEVGERLQLVRLHLPDTSLVGKANPDSISQEKQRNQEEQAFSQRLGIQSSRILLWSGNSIWWLVKNPLVLRLDGAIDTMMHSVPSQESVRIDRDQVLQIIASIQDYDAATETDFLTLKYIRQKSGLILFADVLSRDPSAINTSNGEAQIIQNTLLDSGLDPRILISLIPLLMQEVVEGSAGIWVHGGLTWIVEQYLHNARGPMTERDQTPSYNNQRLNMVKKYLMAWRQRKGFGSIADEVEVFHSVDAALLHLLLFQDSQHSAKPAIPSASRAELYSLVDNGVDCFARAIALLQQYQRLYVLSRLYQNRKMAGHVLGTWRRILEGEEDVGSELRDGENEMRKYLAKIRDINLIHDYGSWLACRNAKLGVQVFADDSSRVKFAPQDVIELLKEQAPDAVKDYLEHLVFGKKNTQYANTLISHYLDSVLQVLESSEEARSILAQSYESYRALQPPKPTYRQFIMDNAVPVSWWQDRLRLLELLGGSHGADFTYDLKKILPRLEPYEEYLVPESIILDGRQGRHQQALRLLTHGLGDYHTAVNYCLMGGASIFHPVSGSLTPNVSSVQASQAILFNYLLAEFLRIEDIGNRLERTSELLERFGSWYDVKQVLNMIPESWSVELVSGFLISAFRRLVSDKNEAMVMKALSGAENLQVAAAFIEKSREIGPRLQETQP